MEVTEQSNILRIEIFTDEQKIDFVLGSLDEDAKREINTLAELERKTVEQIFDQLEQLYGDLTPLSCDLYFLIVNKNQEDI